MIKTVYDYSVDVSIPVSGTPVPGNASTKVLRASPGQPLTFYVDYSGAGAGTNVAIGYSFALSSDYSSPGDPYTPTAPSATDASLWYFPTDFTDGSTLSNEIICAPGTRSVVSTYDRDVVVNAAAADGLFRGLTPPGVGWVRLTFRVDTTTPDSSDALVIRMAHPNGGRYNING